MKESTTLTPATGTFIGDLSSLSWGTPEKREILTGDSVTDFRHPRIALESTLLRDNLEPLRDLGRSIEKALYSIKAGFDVLIYKEHASEAEVEFIVFVEGNPFPEGTKRVIYRYKVVIRDSNSRYAIHAMQREIENSFFAAAIANMIKESIDPTVGERTMEDVQIEGVDYGL